MPVWLVWLVLAIVLAGAEALTGDMFLLMLSGGALAATGTSWLFDWPIWADGVVFLLVSVLLLGVVRPVLRRRFYSGTGLPEPAKALEGKTALVLDRVAQHAGQVDVQESNRVSQQRQHGEQQDPVKIKEQTTIKSYHFFLKFRILLQRYLQ